jgi:hypothetical protein
MGIKQMARKLTVVLAFILVISGVALAAERHGAPRSRMGFGSGVALERRYYYSFVPYYVPYQAPVLVISPYGPSYYVPPAVVVTYPYFCVFHNDGFVSRIGLLDHLAGTHKIPLDAAATICPGGFGSCVFPSY